MSRPIEAGTLTTSGTIGKCREENEGSSPIPIGIFARVGAEGKIFAPFPNWYFREENEQFSG